MRLRAASLRFEWQATGEVEEFLGRVAHDRPGGLVRRSRRVERRAGRASIDVGRSRATGRSVPARLTQFAETTHRGRSRSTTTSRRISPKEKLTEPHRKVRTAIRLRSGSTKGAAPFISPSHRRGKVEADAKARRKGLPALLRSEEVNSASSPKEAVQKTRKFFTRYPCALLDPRGHIEVRRRCVRGR
jgi:hypothetical protein